MTSYPAHESDYYPPYPPREAAPNPWLIRLPILVISGGFLLVLILAAFVIAFQIRFADKVIPGVVIYGVELGGLTRDEAITALASRFTYDQQAVFTFRDGERFWQMSAGALGVSFDADATVERALALGSSGSVVKDMVDQTLTWLNGSSVPPIIRYDQAAAVGQLVSIGQEINQPAVDAQFGLSGTDLLATTGQVGRTLDIPATLQALDQAILQMTTGQEIPLVIRETTPTVWNVDEAANRVRAALSGAIQLSAEGPNGQVIGPWTASVEQIAALLDVQPVTYDDGTQGHSVGIDMSAFAGFLTDLAPGLITQSKDARYRFDPATGTLQVLQPAIAGRTLNVERTLAALEEAVFRYDNRVVPMVFDYTQPRYHNAVTAAELGLTTLVSESTTYYAGSSPERIHNITESVSRFDGIVIGPGEEFSFNFWLGDVSLEGGFVEAKVIEGERTVDGIGGGVCQVSTTVFRAAFTGGFRIIERNAHAYRVGYYEQAGSPPGLDAAIWTPDRDFRFQNDTPYHLLIEASIFPAISAVQFRLYSTNPGRVVRIEPPTIRNVVPARTTRYEVNDELTAGALVQVDYSAEGADVTVERVITDMAGAEISRDSIYTHYLPWGAVFQVAPGDARAGS